MPLIAVAFEVLGALLYVTMLRAARRAFGNKSSFGTALSSVRLSADRARARDWGFLNKNYRRTGHYYDERSRQLYKANSPLINHLTAASVGFFFSAAIVSGAVLGALREGQLTFASDWLPNYLDEMLWWKVVCVLAGGYFVGTVVLWRRVKGELIMYEESSIEQQGLRYKDAQVFLDPEQYPRESFDRVARDRSRDPSSRSISPDTEKGVHRVQTGNDENELDVLLRFAFDDMKAAQASVVGREAEDVQHATPDKLLEASRRYLAKRGQVFSEEEERQFDEAALRILK
jgi:hypothetical protein